MDEDQYAILAQLARRSSAKLLSCKAAGVPCQVVLASNTPTAFARGKGPTPAVVGMPTVALAPWRLISL